MTPNSAEITHVVKAYDNINTIIPECGFVTSILDELGW